MKDLISFDKGMVQLICINKIETTRKKMGLSYN